jgi:ribosomal protein L28
MFDDGLHTFYAAHFDFFITNDDRCKFKAEKTYEKMKVCTRVIKIDEISTLQAVLGRP